MVGKILMYAICHKYYKGKLCKRLILARSIENIKHLNVNGSHAVNGLRADSNVGKSGFHTFIS